MVFRYYLLHYLHHKEDSFTIKYNFENIIYVLKLLYYFTEYGKKVNSNNQKTGYCINSNW